MKCKPLLDEGRPLRELELKPDEKNRVASFQFLTLKPTLTLINTGDDDDAKALGIPEAPKLEPGKEPPTNITIPIRARLEMEISQLPPEEREVFMKDFGIQETIRDVALRLSYALLGQMSVLTGGDKEVRAWTIRRGSTAVEAARKIHQDIAKGFARALVLSWIEYVSFGG